MDKHIFLIGFMGAGKTSTSAELKNLMNVPEIDMDSAIESEYGMEIREMFEKYGEAYFRDAETQMLKKLAGQAPAVISCGGGCVLRPENVALMKESGTIILLSASPDVILDRVKGGESRPLLNGHMDVDYIAQMMEKRRPAYEGACDIRMDTDGKTPLRVAEEILAVIG